MTDLFGDIITRPTCSESAIPKRLMNAAHGFPEFWQAWPSGPRKVGKQQCLNRWAKLACCESAGLIAAHVEWMKTQEDWIRGFVPMPFTYLNQQGWAEWTPPVVQKKRPDALAEIKAHKGTAMPAHIKAQIAKIKGTLK